MATPVSVRIERTNFEGSWDEVCPHCSRPRQEHRITHGPFNEVLYEHRMPCIAEKNKLHKERRRIVLTAKTLIAIGWILVPLVYLLLQQFVALIGWIAFGIGIFQLAMVTIKHFGDPDRWIPGHKKEKDDEFRKAQFIYHCERNPEGFARLRLENLRSLAQDSDEKKI
jgi:hypothetical protein